MSNNPYAAPQASLQDTVPNYGGGDPQAHYLSKLAHATRFGRSAILAILVAALLIFFIAAVGVLFGIKPADALMYFVAILVAAIPPQLIATGQFGRLLGKQFTQSALSTLVSLLPGLGIIPLVTVTRLGSQELDKHGVKVGALGPSKAEVARLQQAAVRYTTNEGMYVEPLKTTSAHPQTSANSHQA